MGPQRKNTREIQTSSFVNLLIPKFMFIDQYHCLSTAPSTVFDCTADSRANKFSGLSEKVFSRELGRSLDRLRLHSRLSSAAPQIVDCRLQSSSRRLHLTQGQQEACGKHLPFFYPSTISTSAPPSHFVLAIRPIIGFLPFGVCDGKKKTFFITISTSAPPSHPLCLCPSNVYPRTACTITF